MRNLLIGMSLVFLSLSGAVTFKALGLPSRNLQNLPEPERLAQQGMPPQVEEVLGKFAREQAENRLRVEELQATIAKLEDRLTAGREAAKNPQPGPAPQKKGRLIGVVGGGDFLPGQDSMNEKMTKALDALASEIRQSPDSQVIIEGHADQSPIRSSGGRYSDNLDLSFLRAKAVAQALEKKGVPLERMSVVGYSDTRPVASNDTEEGKAKNRRVEIKLVPRD